ncbi:MAG TPA: 1-deoxy-D-xylulose-5-phosphate reductoisomerase [Spirochaetota bacterium]|nr:1-deoxy-D-xylulose-5-phosphate reductoisomerase [Spirochaetota bacterium]
MPSDVIILGSTGSIGCSTLRVIDEYPDLFSVKGLVCNCNVQTLGEQLERYKPRFCGITSPRDDAQIESLKICFPKTRFFTGDEAALDVVSEGADICVSAIVGAAGFLPSLYALKSCKRIALANKETLVMAGDLFFEQAASCETEIIPVDSEHGALFALLDCMEPEHIDSVILTASGGSLRDYPLEKLAHVTPEEALAHPTWNMGSKITIDSATLMKKGFEVMEAHHLFSLPYERIKVLVHPESLIHSLVQTTCGALHAHLGIADMAFPISYAMLYPRIRPNNFEKLDLVKAGSLTFRELDKRRYPALDLCYNAGRAGGAATVVLNAANEIAVHSFLSHRIGFSSITEVTLHAVDSLCNLPASDVQSVLDADRLARETAREYIDKME